jgi:tRNA threonylcarbamoyladenosine biosynthesis protein TsaB
MKNDLFKYHNAMLILSIETSASEAGSWALLEDKKIIHEENFSGKTSVNLFPSLEKHRDKWFDAKKILVGVGPGSFSGVRVAIAAAQGLSLSMGCEVVPARSSGAVAHELSEVSMLGVFSQARREEYFVTFYEKGKLARLTQLIHANELENFLSKCLLAVSADDIVGIKKKTFPRASHLALHFLKYGSEPDLSLEPVHIAATV